MKTVCLYLLIGLLLVQCSGDNKKGKPGGGVRKTDKLMEAFFPEGTLQSSIPLKDGKPDGLSTEYYRNGVKSREIEYKKGLKHGVFRRFNRNGELVEESHYESDLLNGVETKFTKEGKIHSEAFFIDGMPCVGLKEYLPSGALRTEYPQIVITPVDKTKENGTYYLILSLTNKAKVEYYTGTLTDEKYIGDEAKLVSLNDNGDGEIKYEIKRGASLHEKINVIAKIRTIPLKNDYIAQLKYEIRKR